MYGANDSATLGGQSLEQLQDLGAGTAVQAAVNKKKMIKTSSGTIKYMLLSCPFSF